MVLRECHEHSSMLFCILSYLKLFLNPSGRAMTHACLTAYPHHDSFPGADGEGKGDEGEGAMDQDGAGNEEAKDGAEGGEGEGREEGEAEGGEELPDNKPNEGDQQMEEDAAPQEGEDDVTGGCTMAKVEKDSGGGVDDIR